MKIFRAHLVIRTINLLKGEPVDYDPEVVEEGEGDHHGPVVTEAARRVEHEGPVWAGTQPPARVRRPPPQAPSAPAAQSSKNNKLIHKQYQYSQLFVCIEFNLQ